MKDRIRELAEQAGHKPLGTFADELMDIYNKKFADLIIQDCLLSLEPNPMAPEIDYAVEEKFYRRSAEKIKRHFGIKP